MKRYFLLWLLFSALTLLFASINERNVLIISSYHEGYVWEDNIVAGMVSKLKESPLELKIYHEQLDVMRIPFNPDNFADWLIEQKAKA